MSVSRRWKLVWGAFALFAMMIPTTAFAQLRVSVVDWVQGRPEIPHPALNDRPTMLQAIAEGGNCGGNYQYRWDINGDQDFDDANEQMRNASSAAYGGYFAPLGLDAQLPDAQGDRLFFPKIEVTCGGETVSSTMPVKVTADKLCPNYPNNPMQNDEGCGAGQNLGLTRRIHANRAVDRGLWYLFLKFSHRGDDGHGHNVHTCTFQNNQGMYGHGHALNAFLRRSHGHGPGRDSDVYYRHVTECGLNALLSTYNMGGLRFNDVNNEGVDGQGIFYQNGVLGGLSRYGYSTSSWVEPLASFGDADYVAQAGPNNIRGRSLRSIGQDLADGMLHCMSSDHAWYYNCQNGGGAHSDASTNGWSPEALRLLERKMGIETYQWAKDGQRGWLDRHCNNGTCNYHHGGYKLSGNGLVGYGWVDDQVYSGNGNHLAHVRSLEQMVPGAGYWGLYYIYAMTKGLRSFVPEITLLPNGRDWSAMFNEYLIPLQAANGSWNWAGSWPWQGSVDLNTRSALTVQIIQTWLETQAVARAFPAAAGPGIDITFDHSWSHVLDQSTSLAEFRWDVAPGNGPDGTRFEYRTNAIDEPLVFQYDDDLDWGEVVTHEVTLEVVDSDGRVVVDDASVVIELSLRNHVPVIVPHPDGQNAVYGGYLGTPIVLDGRASFDVDTDHEVFPGDANRPRGVSDRITSIHFDLNLDGDYDDAGEDGTLGPVVFIPREGGQAGDRVAVPMRVCDDGQWNGECYDGVTRADCTECAFGSASVVVVENVEPPTIDAGGPYTGIPEEEVQLDLTGTRDPEGVLGITYRYELIEGDGELRPTPGYPGGNGDWGPEPIYIPDPDGARVDIIRASVTDYGDLTSQEDIEINVANVPPVIDFWEVTYTGRTPALQGGINIENLGNGRYRASVNAIPDTRWDAWLPYEAHDPYGEPISANGDIDGNGGNEGAVDGNRGTIGSAVVDAGAQHRATLRVTDGDDAVSESRDLQAPPADPTLRYFFDVGGDGSLEVAGGGQNWVEFEVPPGTGAVTIAGSVRGSGGDPAPFQQQVQLGNRAPAFEVARVVGQDDFDVVVSASAVDPDGDEITYTIDWGDGSPPSVSVGGIADHTYPAGQFREYTVTVTADDGRGGAVQRQFPVDFPEPPANQPPSLEFSAVLSKNGFTATVAASAVDPDGDPITYTFDWGDGSQATSNQGGVANHTYPDGQFRTYDVTVTADDGRGGRDQAVIEVEFPRPAENQNPVFDAVELISQDGFDVVVAASAGDPDGDPVSYTVDWGDGSEPTVSAGGVLRHTYPEGQFREYTITVTANDDRGGSAESQVDVDFPEPPPNRAPVIAEVNEIGRNGFEVVLAATAIDPDGDPLTYTFDWGDGDEPTESAGGIAAHTFPLDAFEAYEVTITADDGRGGVAETTVEVDFPEPAANRPPQIAEINEISREGFEVVLAATAVDPDSDPITYTFDWGDGQPATVSAGGIASHPFPDGQFRAYTVTVTADDGRGGTAQSQIEIDFPEPAANRAPQIAELNEIARDGFEVVLAATAIDPDGDPITYTFMWDDGSEPTHSAGGIASHTFPDGQFRAYDVVVLADDGRGGTDQAVIEVDFPEPAANRPPAFDIAEVISQGDFDVIISANAVDPDGDPVTYTINWGDGSEPTVSAGGVVRHDYPEGQFRFYDITITADDGRGGQAEAELEVDFPEPAANRPPVITELNQLSQDGFDVAVAAAAVDPDGDPVTYTFEWGDDSDDTPSAGGVAAHTYPDGQFRRYTVTVTADDGQGGQSQRQMEIDFPEPAANRPPAISELNQIGRDGFEIVLAATAADPDGDPITYRFVWGDGSDDTISLGGIASHTYPDGQFRAYDVTVIAEDGRGGSDDAEIEVDFPEPAANRPPVFDSLAEIGRDGFDIVLAASAVDPDGDVLTYTFEWDDGTPDTRNAGGIANHTFPAAQFRGYTVTVTADDGRGGSASQQIGVAFQRPAENRPPVIDQFVQIGRDGFEVVLTASAIDPDGDQLTYAFHWGDGDEPTENVGGLATHAYPDGQFRAHDAEVVVTDGRGGEARRALRVDFPAPAANEAPIIARLDEISRDGFRVALSASAVDPDGDPLTYTFDFGDGAEPAVFPGGVAVHDFPADQFQAYEVTVTVDDGRGGEAQRTIEVDFPAPAANRPPAIDFAREIGRDGFEVVISASATDPDGDAISYTFEWGDGEEAMQNAGGVGVHTYPAGVFRGYTVTVTADDGRGGSAQAEVEVDFPAPAANRPPTIEVARELGRDGFTVIASITAVDPDADPLSYTFMWGDGSPNTQNAGGLAEHRFPLGQFRAYTVEVTVDDGQGGRDTAQFEVDFPAPAANRAPTIESLREIGRDGFEAVISATATDPDGDALTYTFEWADGTDDTVSAGGIAVHSFPRNQFETYTVTVTADDGNGGRDEAQIEVDFPEPAANRPPVIEVARVLGIDGFEAVLTATAVDPDGDDLTYTFEWGDDTEATRNAGGVAAHTYAENVFRPYTVTITADDGRGGSAQAEVIVDFPPPAENVPPFFEVARVLSQDGFGVVLTATAVDPNGDDVTYTFDWGDGSPVTTNRAGLADHAYPVGDYRAYTVTITADDGNGGEITTEVVVDFPPPDQNRAPIIEVARVLSQDGFEATLTASAVDPDGDPITYDFEWGDGTPNVENQAGLAAHDYPDGEYAAYTVTITARDDRGGEASVEVPVEFIAPDQNRPPVFELVRELGRDGFDVTVAASAIDPDGDPLTYTFDWGDASPETSNGGGIAAHQYPAGDFRVWPVTVTVEDGRGGEASAELEIAFVAPDQNNPPVIEELRLVRQDGFEVLAVVGAVDPDGDDLVYTFDWSDGGENTINRSGLAAHRFPAGVYQAYTVTVTADDLRGGTAQAEATVTFEAPAENQPPVIREVAVAMGPHGHAELVIDAADPENGPLTYFVSWGDSGADLVRLPGGFGPHTYPYPADGEPFTGRVVVADDQGLEAEAEFPAPVVDAPTEIRDMAARELRPGTWFFDVVADDADSPGALQYSWDFDNDGVWDVDHSDNSEGVWIYPEPGQQTARVAVTDPWSGQTVESEIVVGEDGDGNRPPRIEDLYLDIGPGGQAFLVVDAVDPEGGQLVGEVLWGDEDDAQWSPLPALNGQHGYDYDPDQIPYEGMVRVTDNQGAFAEMPFIAPIPDAPTELNEISISVLRDGLISARASARDDDTADLRYAFDFDADGQRDTGFLDEGIARHEYDVSGGHDIIVHVLDTWSGVTTTFEHEFDLPPWVERPPLPDGQFQGGEGECIAFQVGEDGLSYKIAEEICARDENPDEDLWSWNFGDDFEGFGSEVGHRYADNGAYLAIVEGGPPEAPQSAKINVSVFNTAPNFITEPPELATAGREYAYRVEIDDPGLTDEIQLKLSEAPQGMALSREDDRAWLLLWNVPPEQAGDVAVELLATDGHKIDDQFVPDGGQAIQRYIIRISGDIDPDYDPDPGIPPGSEDDPDLDDFTGSGCSATADDTAPSTWLALFALIGLVGSRRRRR